MPLTDLIKRKSAECAASHPWIDPWGWAWEETPQWDIDHANWFQLDKQEPDPELLSRAFHLADAGAAEAAFQIFLELAQRGSGRAMVEIAVCHQYGSGVPVDLVEAENWYRQACAAGSQYAMIECARFAASRQDFLTCDAILQAGVNDSSASAAFWQAWYRHKFHPNKDSYRTIYPVLKLAAKSGHPGARVLFASLAIRGKFGILRIPFGVLSAMRLAAAETSRHHPESQSPAAS